VSLFFFFFLPIHKSVFLLPFFQISIIDQDVGAIRTNTLGVCEGAEEIFW